MRKFNQGFDTNRATTAGGFVAPDYVESSVLAESTPERVAIPSGTKWIIFKTDGILFGKFGGGTVTAAIPTTETTNGSASCLIESGDRILIPSEVTHVSLVASAARIVTMLCYQ